MSDTTITPTEGVYSFTNVDVKEGTLLNVSYTKDSSANSQRFLLEDNNIDITTLKVTVQNSITDLTTATYTEASNILEIGSNSEVYFIDAVEKGFYEVTFGDDILGKALSDGNIVTLEYVVCNEDEPNGASDFTLQTGIGGSTNATITTVINAQNGGH